MTRRLLLADDSVTMQKVIELILVDEGFEIKTTTNGEEALAAIPSFKPDIVLADVDMPKINGYQLCERIKQDRSTSKIAVILLAGAFEPFNESLAKEVKADDFIVKPFESEELTSKIYAALTASAVEEEEAAGVAEAAGTEEAEEDLWEMEEIIETGEAKGPVPAEEVGVVQEEAEVSQPEVEEAVAIEEARPFEVEIPSKDEISEIVKKTINDKISSLLSSIDIKEAILSSLVPLVKDSIEEILPELTERVLKEMLESPLQSLNENLPDLAESALKEMLEGQFTSLTKEIEKVIWKVVPDVADTIISKEIERIRSEF